MSAADDLSRTNIKSRNMEEIIAGSFDNFPQMCFCKMEMTRLHILSRMEAKAPGQLPSHRILVCVPGLVSLA